MARTSLTATWQADVERALALEADEKTREGAERYFKGVISFVGVKTPRVKAVLRALVHGWGDAWKRAPLDDKLGLALALLRSSYMEERQVGQLVLDGIVKKLVARDAATRARLLDEIEGLFDAGVVDDWATCDGLSGRALRWLLPHARERKRIIAWSRADKAPGTSAAWKQRASAVAFVNEARHGAYDDDVIAVCARIVRTPERFVQLGCGWVLRELSLSDRARVLAFIDAHAAHLSREGLRYATEKLPRGLRDEVHARHARLARG